MRIRLNGSVELAWPQPVGWVSDSVTQQFKVNADTNVGLRDKAANPTYDNAKTSNGVKARLHVALTSSYPREKRK